MRKITAIILVFILAFSFLGFSTEKSTKSKSSAQAIYEYGLEYMSLLDERREFLSDLMDQYEGAEFGAFVDQFENYYDCDLSEPSRVYQFILNDDEFETFWEETQYIDSVDLPDYMKNAALLTATNLANMNTVTLMDQYELPAAAIGLIFPQFSASTSFVYKGLEETESYLYLYKNSFPIQATFTPGDDDTVIISLNVIIAEDFPTSEKDIKAYYSERYNESYTRLFDLEKIKL